MHSIKIKLTLIMATLVIAVVGIVILLDSTLFEKYYVNNRVKELDTSYHVLENAIMKGDNSGEIYSTIMNINARHNISVSVISSNWKVMYSTQNSREDVEKVLQEVIFNESGKMIIKDEETYQIIKRYDESSELTYLTIYGIVNSPSQEQICMQITIESIKENVSIFNRFLILAGTGILILSLVIVYFIADKFTKPVKELSKIAEAMSEMNFNVKYTRGDKDEIGLLGKSMNIMSDKLENQISEIKAANIKLKKDIEIKTKNDEMRREFLSNVSHELKTPIALIQGYAEGLKEGVIDDAESKEFYCDVIMDEAIKMNEMVKKLLTLNQIEFGNDSLNIERFSLSEMTKSLLKSIDIKFKQQNISVKYELCEESYIWADQFQIEEVITNYVTNAINHCDYSNEIMITITKIADNVEFSIFNTGNHIPEEDIDRIWEKFYKVDKARTREYGGNGIGLSIVKAILDNYEAEYGAENVSGGVRFWFIMHNKE